MVEEFLCVLCAFIILGGVESNVLLDYTKVLLPFSMVFMCFS
jgi:hypothetical protein